MANAKEVEGEGRFDPQVVAASAVFLMWLPGAVFSFVRRAPGWVLGSLFSLATCWGAEVLFRITVPNFVIVAAATPPFTLMHLPNPRAFQQAALLSILLVGISAGVSAAIRRGKRSNFAAWGGVSLLTIYLLIFGRGGGAAGISGALIFPGALLVVAILTDFSFGETRQADREIPATKEQIEAQKKANLRRAKSFIFGAAAVAIWAIFATLAGTPILPRPRWILDLPTARIFYSISVSACAIFWLPAVRIAAIRRAELVRLPPADDAAEEHVRGVEKSPAVFDARLAKVMEKESAGR
ncbi:putative integron gene cassette protein [Burkholderiales bacterium GJ-E10]|nr:putative integron gene cassette protein [Burkholderiales bacterium GJ-E10]